MHIKKAMFGVLLIMGVASQAGAAPPTASVLYSGNLVAEPCIIAPGDEEIRLDFGTIIDKYLYLNTRTQSKPFEIRLVECDLSIGKTVKVMFQGAESIALPGLLAVDSASEAKGIAIGLETLEAKLLPLNKESDEYQLQAGSSLIALNGPRAMVLSVIAFGSPCT